MTATTLVILGVSGDLTQRLLMPAISGDRSLFLRFDKVEWSWRVLAPVLKAWEKGTSDFYPSGSEGPATQERLLDPGQHWRSIINNGEDKL